MAEIVNLRRVKKQRAREQAAAEAAENRVRHGLPGVEKRRQKLDGAVRKRLLDQAKLDDAAGQADGSPPNSGPPDDGSAR